MNARMYIRRLRGMIALRILGDIPCVANAKFDGTTLVVWGDGALIKNVTILNPATPMEIKGNKLLRKALPENLSGFGHFTSDGFCGFGDINWKRDDA